MPSPLPTGDYPLALAGRAVAWIWAAIVTANIRAGV
jgi:hypothetical protein